MEHISVLLCYSRNIKYGVILLVPYPQIKTEAGGITNSDAPADSELKRLRKYYEKTGFTFIKNGDVGVMHKKVDVNEINIYPKGENR